MATTLCTGSYHIRCKASAACEYIGRELAEDKSYGPKKIVSLPANVPPQTVRTSIFSGVGCGALIALFTVEYRGAPKRGVQTHKGRTHRHRERPCPCLFAQRGCFSHGVDDHAYSPGRGPYVYVGLETVDQVHVFNLEIALRRIVGTNLYWALDSAAPHSQVSCVVGGLMDDSWIGGLSTYRSPHSIFVPGCLGLTPRLSFGRSLRLDLASRYRVVRQIVNG